MIKQQHYFFLFIPLLLLVVGALWLATLKAGWTFQTTKKQPTAQYSQLLQIMPNTPMLGNANAVHHIILFGDTNCIACNNQIQMLQPLIQTNPNNVSMIWESAPISFPESTVLATKYAYCANQQNIFWPFIHTIINNNAITAKALQSVVQNMKMDKDTLKKCLQSVQTTNFITRQQYIATSLSIQQVPTIFLDDTEIPTPTSTDAWKNLLGI